MEYLAVSDFFKPFVEIFGWFGLAIALILFSVAFRLSKEIKNIAEQNDRNSVKTPAIIKLLYVLTCLCPLIGYLFGVLLMEKRKPQSTILLLLAVISTILWIYPALHAI